MTCTMVTKQRILEEMTQCSAALRAEVLLQKRAAENQLKPGEEVPTHFSADYEAYRAADEQMVGYFYRLGDLAPEDVELFAVPLLRGLSSRYMALALFLMAPKATFEAPLEGMERLAASAIKTFYLEAGSPFEPFFAVGIYNRERSKLLAGRITW